MVIVKQWNVKNKAGHVVKKIMLSRDAKTKTGTYRVTQPYCVSISQDIGLERQIFQETYSKRFNTKAQAMKIINKSK